MAVVLEDDALIFDEKHLESYPDETRPWDRLTFLWRSWFSLRVLANMGAVFRARREGERIRIERDSATYHHNSQAAGLDRLYGAASGLGDHVLLGLSGYFLADSQKPSQLALDEVDGHLSGEGVHARNLQRVPPNSYGSRSRVPQEADENHPRPTSTSLGILGPRNLDGDGKSKLHCRLGGHSNGC